MFYNITTQLWLEANFYKFLQPIIGNVLVLLCGQGQDKPWKYILTLISSFKDLSLINLLDEMLVFSTASDRYRWGV